MGQDTDIIALVGAGDQGLATPRGASRRRRGRGPLRGRPGPRGSRDRTGPRARHPLSDRRRLRRAHRRRRGRPHPRDRRRPDVLAALEAEQTPRRPSDERRGMRLVARLLAEIAAVERARERREGPLPQAGLAPDQVAPLVDPELRQRDPRRLHGGDPRAHPRDRARRSTPASTRHSPPSPSGGCWPTCAASTATALETGTVHLDEAIERGGRAPRRARRRARRRDPRRRPRDGPDLRALRPAADGRAPLRARRERRGLLRRDGGLVEVSVEVARRTAGSAVAVRDHGIGIPERCLPRIFDEDYRADVAVKQYPDGAGLGLAIAREIADLHRLRPRRARARRDTAACSR